MVSARSEHNDLRQPQDRAWPMTKEQTYQRAREESERIKQDAYAAANQPAVDSIAEVDGLSAVLRSL